MLAAGEGGDDAADVELEQVRPAGYCCCARDVSAGWGVVVCWCVVSSSDIEWSPLVL